MVKNTIRKQLLDQFQKHLETNYADYCDRQSNEQDISGLVTYLIDQELIPASTLKRYTILKEFQKVYSTQKHNKTQTVSLLAERFNLSERTVWSMLKYGEQLTK